MSPQELYSIMSGGLLSFPQADVDAGGDFDPVGYAARLGWLSPCGASALFVAGGTGEFLSLTNEEYPGITKKAVQTRQGKVPIIGGASGPTWFAVQCAQEAERQGARGILLMLHFMTEACRVGAAHGPDQPPRSPVSLTCPAQRPP